ncbi:MAG TPA: M48 family metalloprotease [Nannocystaceae bacterium]|nr:M48 family metalloprotease [Nannocystaceae bacterium]
MGALLIAACSRNPATGKLQFGLPSNDEEITLGREADADVRRAMPVYDEVPTASKLVADVGAKLAKDSERPQLPWSFTLLDEPAVNAFALPGGWVYVTRGLIVHLGSDDELAAVIAHEEGHVTARHGVVQLRKQNTARRTVGIFRVIDPNLRHVGGIAASAAGVALLKYSRDDEHQADDLAVRYVKRGGWDQAALVRVFEVLTSLAQGAEKAPPWLSTHPDPQERRDRTAGMLGITPPVPAAAEPEFLAAIEGVVVGPDPRDGFLATPTLFAHPRRGYELQLPSGWKIIHDRDQVIALSPDEKAIFVSMPTKYDTPIAALTDFFADSGMTRGEHIQGTVGGFPFESSSFAMADESGSTLMGLVAFVAYEGKVIAMVAIGPEQGWGERTSVLANTFGSFGKIADARVAKIDPLRVHIVTLAQATSIAELAREQNGALDAAALARLNGVAPDSQLPAGRAIKLVKQGPAPR